MNKLSCFLGVIIISTLFSCNSTDFSNPEEVVIRFRELTSKNENQLIYEDFLSVKSKELVTSDEFVQTRIIHDSILNSRTHLESKVSSLPSDENNPSFRRFKVDEKSVFSGDTLNVRYYYTLINEDGQWKIIWTGTLKNLAEKKSENGNYSEARDILEKIISIDPYSGEAYNALAWTYYRDKSLTKEIREEGIVKNASYAMNIEEDNSEHYNILASYYDLMENKDLSIHYFERALAVAINKKEKGVYYANLSGVFSDKKEYEKAEDCLKKALDLDQNSAFYWLKYGNLMKSKRDNSKAKEYYEIALQKPKMEKVLQGSLYALYSICCFDEGLCESAKEYAFKALDMEPNNEGYQSLQKLLSSCKEGTKDGYQNLMIWAYLLSL